MKKALIIGGGFAGCSAAHMLSLKGGWDTTVVEKGPFLGAGNKTQWYGGHPYTFGPRHFLTQNPKLFDFLNKYLPLRKCPEHEFLSYVESDDAFYNYPIHVDDIPKMPENEKIFSEINLPNKDQRIKGAENLEDYWRASVGDTLYEKFINHYSKKMWQVDDNKLIDDFAWSPKGVALKTGPKEAWDTAISAYPYAADGYDSYFDIATANSKVLLNTSIENYDIEKKIFVINGTKMRFDVVVSTISPDTLFDYSFGELPFIGREFYPFVLPVKFALPENVYFLYYTGKEKFTRIVEYKKFTRQRYEDNSTLLGIEIPAIGKGKHYPVPFKSEIDKAQKYLDILPEGVFSVGRAGKYRYGVDIDDCIQHAFDIVDAL